MFPQVPCPVEPLAKVSLKKKKKTCLLICFCSHWKLVVVPGLSLAVAPGLLIAVASLVAEHWLRGVWASVVAACGLSSCGSRALEHRLNSCVSGSVAPRHVGSSRIRDEPVSPALASGFLATGLPGSPKSQLYTLDPG